MKTKAIGDVQERINLLRENSLEKLTVYLSISIFFLSLAFFARLNDSDWQDIHLLGAVCIVVAFIVVFLGLNKKLSYLEAVYSYLGLGLIMAVVEFIGMGIAGMGEMISLFCIMLSLFYLDRKSTYILSLIILVIFGIASYQYLYAGKSLSENDLLYMSWHSSWIGTFVGAFAFFLIIGMSIYHLQAQMIGLLLEVDHQKRVIEEQKQYIEHLANYDALTGLPSLRLADDRLEKVLKIAAKENHKSAVLFLDLDGFKAINDTHGHDAGDEVLKKTANRISSVIRSSDTACRIGGDEFLLIVERIEDQSDLEGLCQRLIKSIGSPLDYQNTTLTVGVSIGAASYPDSAKTSRSLRLKADELMYQVKKSGKNNYQILMGTELLQSPTLAHG